MSTSSGLASTSNIHTRLVERHFPSFIPQSNAKRKKHSRACKACDFIQENLCWSDLRGVEQNKKLTSYWCSDCQNPLCMEPWFGAFHTNANYKHALVEGRLKSL